MTRALLFALVLALTAAAKVHAQPTREPTAREVLAMATRAAGRLGPERIRELSKRARLSGLVPSLRLAARRGLQQDTTSTSSITADRTDASLGDDLTLEASLSFDLSRLVFASEEVRLLSVERWLANDMRKLLEGVAQLYFQRRRLLAERAVAAVHDPELDLQIAEAEALLDALTAGAFSKALPPAQGHDPWAKPAPSPQPEAPAATPEQPADSKPPALPPAPD